MNQNEYWELKTDLLLSGKDECLGALNIKKLFAIPHSLLLSAK